MIVQWCMKGLALDNDNEARNILDNGNGLVSNWWRTRKEYIPSQLQGLLTTQTMDMHVNHFNSTSPRTGKPFSQDTPYISLSAGTVERDAMRGTNHVHRALKTALLFGTRQGRQDFAYVYTCWVMLAPRRACPVEGVAEEVRDLNTYRSYSPFQLEGEIAAKIAIPDNQVQSCQKWELDVLSSSFKCAWVQHNSRFTPPEVLTNVRTVI